ncbi:unnamed protein product [Prorocentrum cordatum]|uniref:Uncharacterized protein n=1 Tax=Prorocentrum cordatum TaxID=2364126 RepID=A0ABN9PAS4_9DINO|nr:unnamed protein product [Polarella glacialis]
MKPQNILERHLRRRRRRRKRRREEEEGGRKEEGNVKAALKDAREVGAESTRSPRRPRRALQKPARARRRRARPRAWARGSAAGGPNRVGRKGRIAQGGLRISSSLVMYTFQLPTFPPDQNSGPDGGAGGLS